MGNAVAPRNGSGRIEEPPKAHPAPTVRSMPPVPASGTSTSAVLSQEGVSPVMDPSLIDQVDSLDHQTQTTDLKSPTAPPAESAPIAQDFPGICKKILDFQRKLTGQRDKLGQFLEQKRGVIQELSTPSLEKECRLNQEAAIVDCMKVFDEAILNLGTLANDMELSDMDKARMLKKYHGELRAAQTEMKRTIAQQEKRIPT